MANSNNVQNVKFLRNGSVFTPTGETTARAIALSTMDDQLNSLADGTAILGRYQETNGIVTTLVGFAYISGDTKTLTVFDVDGAGADVDEKINQLRQEINNKLGTGITNSNTATAQLETLSGTSSASSADTSVWGAKKYASAYTDAAIADLDVTAISAGDGAFIKSVSQADGKVSATTADMPTVAIQTETGKPIIAVSQTKGTLAASAGTINAQYVNISDSGSLITATDVEGALAEIATEIDAMDLTQEGDGNGKVIIAVSEQDGKVSASATSVSDLTLEGFEANTATTGAVTSADTIEAAINKLENKAAAITIANADGSINVTTGATGTDINVNIKSGERVLAKDGSAGVYTNIAISAATSEELSTLGTNVQEAYKLVATDGTRLGEFIKIYKDSSLVNLYLGHVDDLLSGTTSQSQESESSVVVPGIGSEALVWIVQLADGKYKLAAVDVESFLQESEFASGVTADSATHIVHGVVDSASEKDSQSTPVAFLTVGADGFKVSGIKDEIDRKINALDADKSGSTTHVGVRVEEVNGKISAVTVTEDDIASAQGLANEITARGNADTELSNRLGTGVTTTNTATAQLAALVGTTADTKDSSSIVGAKKYADDKVTTIVEGLDADVSGNTTHVKVNVVEANGVITNVNVEETDIASANDLTNEIGHRKAVDGVSGDAYAADTNTHYISAATSLFGADQALDTALNVVDGAMLTGVTAGNGINVSSKSDKSQTISAKVKDDNGIVNDASGLHLGTIDCGTY